MLQNFDFCTAQIAVKLLFMADGKIYSLSAYVQAWQVLDYAQVTDKILLAGVGQFYWQVLDNSIGRCWTMLKLQMKSYCSCQCWKASHTMTVTWLLNSQDNLLVHLKFNSPILLLAFVTNATEQVVSETVQVSFKNSSVVVRLDSWTDLDALLIIPFWNISFGHFADWSAISKLDCLYHH